MATEWIHIQDLGRSEAVKSVSLPSNLSEGCQVGLQLLKAGLQEGSLWSLKSKHCRHSNMRERMREREREWRERGERGECVSERKSE